MVYSGFTQMLTGVDLLAKVKDLGDVSKTDLATQCGYVSQKKDGSDRVNFTAFYEALLNAKGIDLRWRSRGNWQRWTQTELHRQSSRQWKSVDRESLYSNA